ncbi:MAG: zinc ribbon domain-containing protein [Thermoplasmata archaeon]|nr:zinc ribbon domain-containing protein [Thermoplasmata archaeon]
MIIFQESVIDILSTILFWFAVIALIALAIGAIIFFLKVYLITEIVKSGRRDAAVVSRQCQYCGRYTPDDSAFCKNCGARLR